MELPELAAFAATVLAATGVLPQCVRLGRSRDPEGVSLTGATLGVATEVAWITFMVHEHIWSAVTLPVLMVLANASLVFWIARVGSDAGAASVTVASWVVMLGAVTVFGGWTGLGFVLGFSYAVQITPTIYAAYRSALSTGLAPARWMMVMCETSLWTFYGYARHEPSLLVFGIVAWSSAAVMLFRWVTTRRRLVTGGSATVVEGRVLEFARREPFDASARDERVEGLTFSPLLRIQEPEVLDPASARAGHCPCSTPLGCSTSDVLTLMRGA